MVGTIGNAVASATTPLSVRASAAAGILSSDQSQPAAAPSTQISDIISSNADAKLPLYNSVEFVYKQDYGKVVLLEQQPDTGQEITQVPSQYRLQQYAATVRDQRRTQLSRLLEAESAPQKSRLSNPTAGSAVGTAAAKPSGNSAPAPASAPAPQVAPAPQAAGGQTAAPQTAAPAAAPAAHVDIRV
jgi:hypothetical protein